MAKRLTRREIVREDLVHSTLFRVYQWIALNRIGLLGILAAAVFAIFGSYLWQTYQENQNQILQKEFGDALRIYHTQVEAKNSNDGEATHDHFSSNYQFSSTQERDQKALTEFSSVATRYPGTRLGVLARYYAALTKHRLGQSEETRTMLYAVIEEEKYPKIQNLARNYSAQLALLEKNHQQAIQLLTEILETPSPNFPKQTALLRLAQTYEEVDNREEALSHYRKVTSEYPASEHSRQAQSRIDQIEAEAASETPGT